jgi:hypothetical protein
MVSADPAQILRRLGVELDPSEPAVADVPHNRWLTSGIWKVAREAEPVVVKILRRSSDEPVTAWDAHWTAGSDDPQHWNYWAREGLAYLSGLVTAYEDGGIVGPALLAADQRQDEIVLVLEFVEGRPAENWGIAEYGEPYGLAPQAGVLRRGSQRVRTVVARWRRTSGGLRDRFCQRHHLKGLHDPVSRGQIKIDSESMRNGQGVQPGRPCSRNSVRGVLYSYREHRIGS